MESGSSFQYQEPPTLCTQRSLRLNFDLLNFSEKYIYMRLVAYVRTFHAYDCSQYHRYATHTVSLVSSSVFFFRGTLRAVLQCLGVRHRSVTFV